MKNNIGTITYVNKISESNDYYCNCMHECSSFIDCGSACGYVTEAFSDHQTKQFSVKQLC